MQVKEEGATWEKGGIIDLDQSFIVLAIPDDTVELEINAKIYIDGELHDVFRHMDFSEIRAAIRDGEQNYIPDDALFTLAPTRREKLKRLLDRHAFYEEEESE